MFGYRTEARLRAHVRGRREAQRTWPFLPDNALHSIDTCEDIRSLEGIGKGIPVSAAAGLVKPWIDARRGHFASARCTEDAH